MITSSAFRKPQRRLQPRSQRRQDGGGDSDSDEAAGGDNSNGSSAAAARRNYGDDDDDHDDTAEASLEALRIAQFKEKKSRKGGKVGGSSSFSSSTGATGKKTNPVLTFKDHYGEEDDGDVFQVKKSSQSRRLMKQKKADKKRKPKGNNDDDDDSDDEDSKLPPPPPPPQLQQHCKANVIEPELNMKFKDTLPARKEEERSWTLSGKEAEALHFEEEDLEDEEGDGSRGSEPYGDILRTGLIPDAAAIHAARKRRQAAREFSEKNPPGPPAPPSGNSASAEYISLSDRQHTKPGKGKGAGERSRLIRDEDDADDSDEDRISFTGVKSAAKDRQLQQQELLEAERSEDERDNDWEEMQIRKGVKNSGADGLWALQQQQFQTQQPVLSIGRGGQDGSEFAGGSVGGMRKPVAYNLQGIKGRLKERLESQTEVFRRHQSDADRAVDELISSQNEIERLEGAIPDLADKHRFYQELRGYVTDLVECFDEKIVNINYLEEKFYKSKSAITDKLMERRREDVRDQMIELSSKPMPNTSILPPQLSAQQEQQEAVAEAARQRRAAEREGRRRRRLQQRLSSQKQLKAKHNDGMSSDDELSTLEQANLSKTRQDIENQARQILSDVVEEFSTVDGVKERMQGWKLEDPDSYNDAYASLCLPKIFSPLVRLQLLFWNPFAEHNDIDQMEWYKSLSTFAYSPSESLESIRKDPDRKLITLVVEKVILPKVTAMIKAAYDPMSTTQTIRVTGLVNKFVSEYPTLRGDSKQVRDLVNSAKDKMKTCIDNDPYIPIGYSKQISEAPTGGHANFVHRQFWSCLKLLRNVLAWHGILGDGILADLAITSLLNRYILIGLGMNPDPLDAINKSRHVVAALPPEWREQGICKPELQRFAQYLATMGMKAVGVGRDGIQDIVNLLKFIGYTEESDTVKRLRLQ